MAELEVGSEFAGYFLEEVAGRGGMGVVYRARNLITEQQRALKVIAPALSADARFRERFKRESRLAARLEHPNVVPLHEAREEDGRLYLVMRYVDGTDLSTAVKNGGRLAPTRALAIVTQVAAALDAAHEQGIVHRDVKPANVLLASDGGEHAYLTDFGLVKDLSSDSSLTESGVFMGTYQYAAPEQIDPRGGRGVDHRTDIYALGGVLYHALTGELPFSRDSMQGLMAAHLFMDPPDVCAPCPDLPPALAVVIKRAMAKEPDERYASAGSLATAASAALAGSLAAVPAIAREAAPVERSAPEPAASAATPSQPTSAGTPATAPLVAATVEVARPASGSARRLAEAGAAVASLVMVVSLLAPWYETEESGAGGVTTASLTIPPLAVHGDASGLDHFGVAQGAVAVAAVLGLAWAALGLLALLRDRSVWPAMAVAAAALVAAVLVLATLANPPDLSDADVASVIAQGSELAPSNAAIGAYLALAGAAALAVCALAAVRSATAR